MKCIGSGAVTLFAVLRFSTSCQGDWNRSSLRVGNRILLAPSYGKKLQHLIFFLWISITRHEMYGN